MNTLAARRGATAALKNRLTASPTGPVAAVDAAAVAAAADAVDAADRTGRPGGSVIPSILTVAFVPAIA